MKLCLIGGFLGSGKTTAITTAAKFLRLEKISSAVILNDQGSKLVDASFVRAVQIPQIEVTGGCFCCNYQDLLNAIKALNAQPGVQFIFAEAVGSCADLVATIIKPLLQSGFETDILFSVFADGPVLLSLFEGNSLFINEEIQYIYKKQLEEAWIIVVGKADQLTDEETARIRNILKIEFRDKSILFQDSRDEHSVQPWVNQLKKGTISKDVSSLDIEYDRYGRGEAALAWLDATISINSQSRAIEKCFQLIQKIISLTIVKALPVGHIKFFLESANLKEKISYTTGTKFDPGAIKTNYPNDSHASLLVNARVETNPDQLKEIFYQAIKNIQALDCHIEVLELDCFQPGYPRPSFRVS